MPDPLNIDPKVARLGIQSTSSQSRQSSLASLTHLHPCGPDWARHGICGRGILLDLVEYFTQSGKPLPYDPFATHAISVLELEACAKTQGVIFRQGDILILRVGFIQKYNAIDNEGRAALGSREETSYVPLAQSEYECLILNCLS
jgi:hypothetical protein